MSLLVKIFYAFSELEMKQESKMKLEPKSQKIKKKTTLKKKKAKTTVAEKDKLLGIKLNIISPIQV